MPFYGMTENMLIEPVVTTLSEGDSLVVFSDGILVNYPNLEMVVPKEHTMSAQALANYVMETSYKTHMDKNSDPDDMAIGVLCIGPKKDSSETKFPHLVEAIDLTPKYFPTFSISVELPWGSYSYP